MKILVATLSALLITLPTYAFDINPFKKYDGSGQLILDTEQSAGIVASIIIHPVHEELTVKTFTLVKDKGMPGYRLINDQLIEKVIQGVRWNDDPLHLLPDYPNEWFLNFKHASKISDRINSNYDLFYRSHQHDLQFLHAMASSDLETAGETQNAIMMWMEFTYKISIGFIPIHTRFNHLNQFLTPKAAHTFRKYFTQNELRKNWTPAYLFSLRCNREVILPDWFMPLDCSRTQWLPRKEDVQNIALGSLLHVIQDSFSDSHVSRNPEYEGKYSFIHGRSVINAFNAYIKQSFHLHRGADSYPRDFEDSLSEHGFNLEEVSAQIISDILSDRSKPRHKNQWNRTSTYLKNGVFKVMNSKATAGPGKYK